MMKKILLFSGSLCWLLAAAAQTVTPAASEPAAPPAPPQYLCPQDGRMVAASEPVSVECQPMPPQAASAVAAGGLLPFQRMDDVYVQPRQSDKVKVEVHLRNAPPKAPVRRSSVRLPPPPPPPTPKQLIQRDIAAEERALATAQRQLQQARQQKDSAKERRLQQAVADRQANIQALKQELQRK